MDLCQRRPPLQQQDRIPPRHHTMGIQETTLLNKPRKRATMGSERRLWSSTQQQPQLRTP